jgi:hypothetical protein
VPEITRGRHTIVLCGVLLSGLCLVALNLPGASKPASEPGAQVHKWARYINVRYRYSIEYPGDLLIPQGESDNSDGQRFTSKDGSSELAVWGEHAIDAAKDVPISLSEAYAQQVAEGGNSITYKRAGKDWYVVSGRTGSKVFYRKTLAEGGDFKRFELTYPQSKKDRFDVVVGRISRSFHSTSSS